MLSLVVSLSRRIPQIHGRIIHSHVIENQPFSDAIVVSESDLSSAIAASASEEAVKLVLDFLRITNRENLVLQRRFSLLFFVLPL
jgi:hypothetical protein